MLLDSLLVALAIALIAVPLVAGTTVFSAAGLANTAVGSGRRVPTGVMLRRVLAGRSPMSPDRQHLHHLFQNLGFTPQQTANRLIAPHFVGGAVGVAGWQLGAPDALRFRTFLFGVLVYLGGYAWVWRELTAPPPSVRRARRPAPAVTEIQQKGQAEGQMRSIQAVG
jgi:hypothetical protein